MKIICTSPTRQAYWVDGTVLEQLWSVSALYVAKWDGPPNKTNDWFRKDSVYANSQYASINGAFIVGNANVYRDPQSQQPVIGFDGGRHRTRYLIAQGHDPVPIGLSAEHVRLLHDLGLRLVLRPVTDADCLKQIGVLNRF